MTAWWGVPDGQRFHLSKVWRCGTHDVGVQEFPRQRADRRRRVRLSRHLKHEQVFTPSLRDVSIVCHAGRLRCAVMTTQMIRRADRTKQRWPRQMYTKINQRRNASVPMHPTATHPAATEKRKQRGAKGRTIRRSLRKTRCRRSVSLPNTAREIPALALLPSPLCMRVDFAEKQEEKGQEVEEAQEIASARWLQLLSSKLEQQMESCQLYHISAVSNLKLWGKQSG